MSDFPKKPGFATTCIHAGQEPEPVTGAVAVPIFQTSTYVQEAFGKPRQGYEYAPTKNPTRLALEKQLAALEGGAWPTPSRPAWPPRRRSCSRSFRRGTTSSSAATRTAARTASSRRSSRTSASRRLDRHDRPRGRAPGRHAGHADALRRDADEPDDGGLRSQGAGGRREERGRANRGEDPRRRRQHVRDPYPPETARARRDVVVHSTTKYLGGPLRRRRRTP